MAAFSPSDGQFAICCQLCEEQNDIKWKCLTCDFLICTRCCKVHRKIKSTEHHEVVSLDTVAKPTVPNVDFTNIKCTIHDGQVCCLFCVDCKDVICPLCVSKNHNKHDMSEIQEGYRSTLERVETLISEMDIKKFNTISIYLPMLDSIRSTEHSKYETEKGKILSQDKALKKMVDQKTKKLLDELDQKWRNITKELNYEESRVEKISKKLEEEKKTLKIFTTFDAVDNLIKYITEKRYSQNKSENTDNLKHTTLPIFVPGDIRVPILESLHGSLINDCEEVNTKSNPKREYQDLSRKSKEINSLSDNSFEIIGEYKTNLPAVQNLVCCGNGQVWISHQQHENLQKIRLHEGAIQIIKSYKVKAASMAITSSGNLLLSSMKNELRMISLKTETITITSHSGGMLYLTCVWATKDNKVLVGARNNGPILADGSSRKIIKMDLRGNIERSYCLNNEKRPLFTCPYRITTDSDNNIFVIDSYSDDDEKGRVVVISSQGLVKGIYTGHPIINKDDTFTPANLTATPSNNIIVIDENFHAFHVLNNLGQCIKYQSTIEVGINYPLSVCIDHRGLLFIGCIAQYVKKDDAKIYVVKCNGY